MESSRNQSKESWDSRSRKKKKKKEKDGKKIRREETEIRNKRT